MAISAILFDAGGVLYHRPRQDHHLTAFLEQQGITPRHRQIVEKALRAACFDVQSGRISRETFYNAILRVHGLADEAFFAAGREALLRDARDLELFPGVRETLLVLQEAGYRLAVVSDTAHSAKEKMGWLSIRGLPTSLWSAFVVSSEAGLLKAGGASFDRALADLGAARADAAFVGHDSAELANARQLGIVTIAFMPDDPAVETDYAVTSFYGLQDLFLGG